MSRPLKTMAIALLSMGLLYLLAFHGGLTWSALVSSIRGMDWPILVCVCTLTGANLAFGNLKWLLVMRAFASDRRSHPRFVDSMLTTTLGALLGQVMPVQIGVALARSLAGRLGVGQSPGANLGTTAYEQLFDAAVLGVAGVIGLVGLVLSPGLGGWLVLILLAGSTGLFASMRLARLLGTTAKSLFPAPSANGLHGCILQLGIAAARSADFSPSIFAQLIILSLLRYATIVLRAVIVLGALGMSEFAVSAMIAFPFVQTLGFLPITPGNLGVMEWTWSAVLVAAGAATGAAALFAVTARIVIAASQLILLILLIAFRLIPAAIVYQHQRAVIRER